MKPALRRAIRRWTWTAVVGFLLFVILANRWIINSSDAYMYKDAALLPDNEVGIVLGTSPYTEDADPSPYFYGRIRAAADLYQQGKIKRIIVSGANPDSTYNEPKRMQQELVKAGVPQNVITMDYAGFRTLDSIVRAQTVWGLDHFTVITQRFHCYRAVFLGKKLNLSVVAYQAPVGMEGNEPGARNPLREVFARAKAVLDLAVVKIWPESFGVEQMTAPGGASAP